MKKVMYLLSNIPYGKNKPCGYCFTNGYYIYRVTREDNKIYNEKLFPSAEAAIEALLRLRKEKKCQLIH